MYGGNPLDEWSARRRILFLQRIQHIKQETNIHNLSGVWTRNPRNQEVADLHLSVRGHRDRLYLTDVVNF
jgi:hypothetical protein